MEALALAWCKPTASPVAVADFKNLRRFMSSPATARFDYQGGDLVPCLDARVLPDEGGERSPIAKSFRSTFLCSGIRSRDIGEGQTVLKFGPCQELVDESGVETVSSADIVHRPHTRRHEAALLLP